MRSVRYPGAGAPPRAGAGLVRFQNFRTQEPGRSGSLANRRSGPLMAVLEPNRTGTGLGGAPAPGTGPLKAYLQTFRGLHQVKDMTLRESERFREWFAHGCQSFVYHSESSLNIDQYLNNIYEWQSISSA